MTTLNLQSVSTSIAMEADYYVYISDVVTGNVTFANYGPEVTDILLGSAGDTVNGRGWTHLMRVSGNDGND